MNRMNLGEMLLALAAVAFAIGKFSMPRVAAEGGEGLAFLDLRPAAGAMGFVVGVDAAVLAMIEAANMVSATDSRGPVLTILKRRTG